MAKYGQIRTFKGTNYLWEQMKAEFNDMKTFEDYHIKYEPILKEYKHQFNLAAPHSTNYGGFKNRNKNIGSKVKRRKQIVKLDEKLYKSKIENPHYKLNI